MTGAAGVFGSQPTWGAQFVDMDLDGDIDLFNAHHFYSGFLFTNSGVGHFSVWGLPQVVVFLGDRHGWLWCDLDNDGLLDVVCSHGGDGGSGSADEPNELWRGIDFGIFEAVTGAGGMADEAGRGRAFSAADIDGDGDLDLWHAKAPLAASPNSLYRNDGNLTFVDVAAEWGTADELGTVGVLFADWDDDGDPDALVGGDEFARPTTLYRNDGGAFVDVTTDLIPAGLPIISGADWGDWDGDSDLDLVIAAGDDGVWDSWGTDDTKYWLFATHRFDDDGVDIFQFETAEDPVAQFRWRNVIQNDRIFLGPAGVHPTLSSITLTDAYVGAPTFTPGVDQGLYCWRESPGGPWIVHVSAPPGTFGNYSAKINTVTGVSNPIESNLERLTIVPSSARLYRNDGSGFTDVTTAVRLPVAANPRHVTFVDYDNDGDLDLHQVNRGTVDLGNEPDQLFRNDGATFHEVAGAAGAVGFTNFLSDGAVWADIERDGDLDVLVQEGAGPAFFTTGVPGLLYRNDGPAGHWLEVRIGDATGGTTPVGTRATAWIGGQAVHRRIFANCWRGFQPPLEMHFGLGAATVVDSLVFDWPDGTHQSYSAVPGDRVLLFSQDTNPVDVPLGADPDPARSVGQVMPQPARDAQWLDFAGPGDRAKISVTVYDVAGRVVRRLEPVSRGSGSYRVTWDGSGASGQPVPAGVYFLRGEGDVSFVRRAVRVR
ncbi:MAG: FG-GAP-like repeat-containing protein [bacterium]